MNLSSFDVFDTCLIRRCGVPENIFFIIGKLIFGEDYTRIFEFVHNRMYAEQIAAKKNSWYTLEDIYSYIPTYIIGEHTPLDIARKERELEAQSLVAPDSIKLLIQKDRSKNRTIAFISDMYLDYEFIKNILIREQLWKDGDYLYVSQSSKAFKHDGSLFDLVKEDLHPKRWSHYGDNIVSDIIEPQKKNIQTHRIIHSYNRYEELCNNDIFLKKRKEFEIISSLSKSIRLEQKTDCYVSIASDVIAPLYCAFTLWVLEKARKRGLSKLFFVARDSRLFYEIARELTSYYPEIKCQYLYTSRKALYLPSLYEGTFEEISELIKFEGNTIANIFKVFSLPIEEVPSPIPLDINHILTDIESGEIVRPWINQSEVRQFICNKAAEARSLLIDYFIQEGVLGNYSVGLVDLGWAGTGRYCIDKIVKNENFSPVQTYYLGSIWSSHNSCKTGRYDSLFYIDQRDFSYQALFLEHYFSAVMHGTTLGYRRLPNNRIEPILSSIHENSIDIEEKIFQSNKNTSIRFVQYLFLYNLNDIETLKNYSLASWSLLLRSPKNTEIQALLPICNHDPNSNSKEQFVRRLNCREIFKVCFMNNWNTPIWQEACIAYTFGLFSNLGLWLYNNRFNHKRLVLFVNKYALIKKRIKKICNIK